LETIAEMALLWLQNTQRQLQASTFTLDGGWSITFWFGFYNLFCLDKCQGRTDFFLILIGNKEGELMINKKVNIWYKKLLESRME
jgi:hypothetical protein